MGALQIIKLAIKYLPELIDLIKYIQEQIQQGVEDALIRKKIRQITAAFALTDRPAAARGLNDVFRGPK